MIYLDNAATTRPKPPGVAEAVAAAMNDYGNSGRGTQTEAQESARSIYGVRQALAVPGRTVWPSRPIPPWR